MKPAPFWSNEKLRKHIKLKQELVQIMLDEGVTVYNIDSIEKAKKDIGKYAYILAQRGEKINA
jgi:hypothetical protein